MADPKAVMTFLLRKNKNYVRMSKMKKYLLKIWEFLKVLLVAALIVLPIRYFLFQPFVVQGESMVPSFQSRDYLIVDEISYRFLEPKRGDVVVFRPPLDPSQRYIKRIIGLPGETVEIKNGKVVIVKNGDSFILNEKEYLSDIFTSGENGRQFFLKKDEYFVMGDNRDFSYDSRRWGILPEKNIIGKALIRLYPITEISYIYSPSYQ